MAGGISQGGGLVWGWGVVMIQCFFEEMLRAHNALQMIIIIEQKCTQ